jgi:ketosteroid isomerase-like protein
VSTNRVEAELAIRNAVARLAHLADLGDVDAYVELMTDDVVWTMPASPHIGLAASERVGRAEIANGAHERIAAGVQGPSSHTMHTITTVAVMFETDDDAVAESSFVFWGDTATAPVPRSIGRYRDTFRLTADGWRLARRLVTFG